MKNIFIITTLSLIFSSFSVFSQDCDSIYRIVESYLVDEDQGITYVSDGQSHTSFLNNEKAEFTTTLYGGSYYRIAASAGTKHNYAIFTIKDMEDNILFTNREVNDAPFWDFKVESTIPVKIQAQLNTELKVSGCLTMMIGFLK